MTTVYRADIVGSLLRPDYLVRARAQFESREMAPAIYKEIEDRAVDQVIAMQEGAGMDVVTDGELRRHTFIDQLLEAVVGLTPDPEGSQSDHIPVPFYDEGGSEQSVFTIRSTRSRASPGSRSCPTTRSSSSAWSPPSSTSSSRPTS